ncbi:hypothetical protein RclHR1_13770006 [Rhizophagus clarus]|uniref:Uncharacterized protein n=1 Tax=Rhizophagus clarus TaxID=94130 RepID=A0A2Z6R3H2_9GLOM|nr:hypothetical protein RclHR1_13770006 [Rhizophagus clarus]
MSDRSLPQRFFRLPLPKPINGSFSSFKYNELPINNCPINPQISQTPSLDAILCQQTLNLYLIGKLMPNRRGRKPLATMPLGVSFTFRCECIYCILPPFFACNAGQIRHNAGQDARA